MPSKPLTPAQGEFSMNRLLWLLVCGLLLFTRPTVVGFADSASAFNVFKGLEGNWAIRSGDKLLNIQMTYGLGSKGSIVMEQFGNELSVFYRDGQHLLMTHFCNAGNQPRLRLKDNGVPGIFEFERFDITNASENSTAAHVERIVYKIIDERHLDLEIVWTKGNSEESEKYKLTRMAGKTD